jgi:amino acid transporter
VILVAVTVTAITGVRTAARLQTGLLIFEYAVLLGFCGYGIVTGPQDFSLGWFDPFAIPSASALRAGPGPARCSATGAGTPRSA